MKIAVIGGGLAGLSAAYDLANRGHQVEIFEAAPQVGGLAAGFKAEGWEWHLEHFYHHWFESDDDILGLISELGVRDKVFFPRPITSLYHQGKVYPFDNYFRMALFPHLSPFDKVRAAPSAFYLRFTRNWQELEKYTAHEWCIRWMGKRNYELLMEPLLVGKFKEHYQQVNMAWLWARIFKRSPRLGYFEGGFQGFIDVLTDALIKRGVTIHVNSPVSNITPLTEGGLSITVSPDDEPVQFDQVLATISPHLLSRLAPDLPNSYLVQIKMLKSMGAWVVIMALKHQLTPDSYWINIPKNSNLPYLAVVEHTNYVDKKHYNNEHILYCGDYLSADHEFFSLSKEDILDRILPTMTLFNPQFKRDWVRDTWLYRAKYAQPVPPINHGQNIPDLQTPLPGLFWASMSQVYPMDRGTNYAVEIGRRVAKLMG